MRRQTVKRNSLPLVATVVVCAGAGCSGLRHEIAAELVADLPPASQLQIFEAENDLMASLDEVDQLGRALRERKRAERSAEAQLAGARAQANRAEAKADASALALAQAAAAAYRAKIAVLDASARLLRQRLEVQNDFVLVARAKLELAKARLVVKNNRDSAARVDVDDFVAQVDTLAARARAAMDALREKQQELSALNQGWLERRRALRVQSGGALGTPWVDDDSLHVETLTLPPR